MFNELVKQDNRPEAFSFILWFKYTFQIYHCLTNQVSLHGGVTDNKSNRR